jgi:hypothetical protein
MISPLKSVAGGRVIPTWVLLETKSTLRRTSLPTTHHRMCDRCPDSDARCVLSLLLLMVPLQLLLLLVVSLQLVGVAAVVDFRVSKGPVKSHEKHVS